MDAILKFIEDTGFHMIVADGNWQAILMILISFVLMYLAIVKKFEPLLLVPIAFGMLVTNLPGAEMYHEIRFAGGHVHWDLFGGAAVTQEFISEMSAAGVSDAVLASVEVLRRARPFIGSVTTGPSLFLLKLAWPHGIPADCRPEDFPAVCRLPIAGRSERAMRYLSGNVPAGKDRS